MSTTTTTTTTTLVMLMLVTSLVTASPPMDRRSHERRSSGAVMDLDDESKATSKLVKKYSADQEDPLEAKDREDETIKTSKKGRKHKAIFVDYSPFLSTRLRSSYDYPYEQQQQQQQHRQNDLEEPRTTSNSKRYPDSSVFYIRLPPTPYMFVPGLGYISQPPTYSTTALSRPYQHQQHHQHRPNIVQYQPVKPHKQQTYQSQHLGGNPFINLPIDFVSNGKPTSVYHWQKQPGDKIPTDTPITNLDGLSASFTSNGKPTSIYQWQSNPKPVLEDDDYDVNSLDKGPYVFNGKPTSLYLLKSDGTSSFHQSIRYPEYENDGSYY